MEDQKNDKPIILERKREWEHGDQGQGKNCGRSDKPVYTEPTAAPGVCRGWTCDNGEWYAKKYVWRDKATKKIVREEP